MSSSGPSVYWASRQRTSRQSFTTNARRNRYSGKILSSRLDSLAPKAIPGVTIIRPLCGLDNNLYNTLESIMKLDYPKFEIIFALQDDQDEAIPVVRLVMQQHPTVTARIIISEPQLLHN